jgi:hypothetical protein
MSSAVAASTGKNDSIETSAAVTSTAVPKLVFVLMKASSPLPCRSRSGIAIAAKARSRSTPGGRVGRELVAQHGERRIARCDPVAVESLEQVRTPLVEVEDSRGQPFRMQADAEDVDRRLEEMLGDAVEKHLDSTIGGDEAPMTVEDERGVGLVRAQHLLDRVSDRPHLGSVEVVLRVRRRVAGGEEQIVPIA